MKRLYHGGFEGPGFGTWAANWSATVQRATSAPFYVQRGSCAMTAIVMTAMCRWRDRAPKTRQVPLGGPVTRG